MFNNIDLQKPLETAKALTALQTETLTKTLDQQKASGESLCAFFKAEGEKAKSLKTPEELLEFTQISNTGLAALMKAQGEAMMAIAIDAREAMLAEFGKLSK